MDKLIAEGARPAVACPRAIIIGVDQPTVPLLLETTSSAFPVYIVCPMCGNRIRTLTEQVPTFTTHCFACLMYIRCHVYQKAAENMAGPPPGQYATPAGAVAVYPQFIVFDAGSTSARARLQTSASAFPVYVRCPFCGMNVLTFTKIEPSLTAHLCAFIMFLSFCCVCSCLPYLIPSCNRVNHYCPACGSCLGTYSPL